MIPIRPIDVTFKLFFFTKRYEMRSSFTPQSNKAVILRFPCEKYKVISISMHRVFFIVKGSLPNTTAVIMTGLILFLISFYLG